MGTSQNKKLYYDYEGFKNKFKRIPTTDECITPAKVYEIVVNYVHKNIESLEGKIVARPFQPNGDYQKEAEGYSENVIVIDNPPFSKLAEIKRFYTTRGVKFFLFAPHLTLFSTKIEGMGYVVVGAQVIYNDSIKVNTSFVTNLLKDGVHIKIDSDLSLKLNAIQSTKKRPTTKSYPKEVISGALLSKYICRGVNFELKEDEVFFIEKLDEQKREGKKIFGGAYLISSTKAQEILDRQIQEPNENSYYHFSKREEEIIKNLEK